MFGAAVRRCGSWLDYGGWLLLCGELDDVRFSHGLARRGRWSLVNEFCFGISRLQYDRSVHRSRETRNILGRAMVIGVGSDLILLGPIEGSPRFEWEDGPPSLRA
jgi:hypothetical protein